MAQDPHWEDIFSINRVGKEKLKNGVRSGFQRDFDRLIFSSAFRRLQNKTQVFPLPGSTFVHNRLTHSLEVASVGRSLGKIVGESPGGKRGPQGPGRGAGVLSLRAVQCHSRGLSGPRHRQSRLRPFGGKGVVSLFLRQRRRADRRAAPESLLFHGGMERPDQFRRKRQRLPDPDPHL